MKSTTIGIESSAFDVKSSTIDIESTTIDVKSTTIDIESTTIDIKSTTIDIESSAFDVKTSTIISIYPTCAAFMCLFFLTLRRSCTLLLLFWAGALSLTSTTAQTDEGSSDYRRDNRLRYYDYVYSPNIQTPRFIITGLALSNPVIDLTGGTILELSFDDISDDFHDYSYKIIHCNADWQPSALGELEYIDGYVSDRITNYHNSSRASTKYMHYSLSFPNENTRITKSGNYLIKVYEGSDEDKLVLTRRFLVVEPKMRVLGTLGLTAAPSKLRTHQELDFIVDYKGTNLTDYSREIKTVVMQNFRWDNAIRGLQPVFQRENQLVYDFQDVVVFGGGKEFRRLDLTSVRYNTEHVRTVAEEDDHHYHVYLYDDYDRSTYTYDNQPDANGRTAIALKDSDQPDLEGDYVFVHFTFPSPQDLPDGDLYIFGALTDWKCAPANRLRYNEKLHRYECTLRLKQGFHNYIYAYVPHKAETIDTERYEGNWFETENDYNVLVYYRPFGERYDRLVAVQTFNSFTANNTRR